MFRATRMATAAVLALAVAALPVVLDRCAASCEMHHDTVASTPSCHHSTSRTVRIGRVPTPCGHAHNGTAVTSATSSTPGGRLFAALVATTWHSTFLASAASHRHRLLRVV